MITIKIKAESLEDLRKQMKALGYVPDGEQITTIKGGDLQVVLERATKHISDMPDKPKTDYAEQLRLDGVHPQVESLETDAKDSVDPQFNTAEDIKARVEETKTRKRRTKVEIEAEKAAKEAEAEAETESELESEDEANASATEEDDLAGDDTPPVTAEIIRPMIQERTRNGKREPVVALLDKYGAKRFPDLKEEDFQAFYNELVKI